jgi:hypothetical protein
MRPRGEIRELFVATLPQLVAERGAINCRQLAAATCVGFEAARRTLDNMVEAGEVAVVGQEKPAGSRHWLNLYEPADDDTPQPWAGIERAMRAIASPQDPNS